MDEELSNIIVLNDGNGNDVRFEFLDLVAYKGEEYVVLLPADDEDDGEVVILQIGPDDGSDEETYLSVDDEKVLDAVFQIFKERFKDEFDFQ